MSLGLQADLLSMSHPVTASSHTCKQELKIVQKCDILAKYKKQTTRPT